jgi:Fe-S-cluster containining protein
MSPAESADRELLRIIDGSLAEAASRAGGHLACYRGCAVCCFGPFAITALDAVRLREGWIQLNATDFRLAQAILDRASRAVERLRTNFPGDAATGRLCAGGWDEMRFAGNFYDLACPALDPDSGACLLYDHRPVACRTYGLPLRLNGEDLPPCPLCFRGASPEESERCRAEIRTGPIDERIGAEMERAGMSNAHTVVAFALSWRGE